MFHAYLHQVASSLCHHPQSNAMSPLRIVYTAMHGEAGDVQEQGKLIDGLKLSLRCIYPLEGVGHAFASQVFRAFKLPPYLPVMAQCDEDPTFRTTVFPNPEERGALSLAMAYADEEVGEAARLILANDPDADRLAVAER